jgi:hypothetical protein
MIDRLRYGLFTLRMLIDAVLERQGDAIWLTGKEKHSGEPLSIFYYGRLLCYDYLVEQLYAEHTVHRSEENLSVRAGLRLLKSETASDLVIGDLSWPYYHGLPRTRFLQVPPVIGHKMSLPSSWAAVVSQFRQRKTTRAELRKLEKFELSYRTTRERAAAESFYDTMYVPYATQRHGSLADLDSREDVLAAVRSGTLLEVTLRGRVVAAAALHRMNRTMRFLWLGIVDGLEPDLVSAVSAALYCFSIQHAIAENCTEFDMMFSPADLNNGIHRYKRKLGARVASMRRVGRVSLSLAKLTPAAVAVFARMPLAVAGTGNRLSGRIMLAQDSVSRDDILRLGSYYACEGLDRLKFFSARPLRDDVINTDYGALEAELPPLEIHDLSRSTDPAADFCRS